MLVIVNRGAKTNKAQIIYHGFAKMFEKFFETVDRSQGQGGV